MFDDYTGIGQYGMTGSNNGLGRSLMGNMNWNQPAQDQLPGISQALAGGGLENAAGAFGNLTFNPNIGGDAGGLDLGSLWEGIGGFEGAMGLANLIGNGWMANRQLGFAKDAMRQNRKQFNMNYDAQQRMINGETRARQARRYAHDPSTMSPEEYISKYGIPERNKKKA